MKYICIDGFKGVAANAEVEEKDGKLFDKEEELCYVSSQNAYDHFAKNGDGKGLERHALIQSILGRIAQLAGDHSEKCKTIRLNDELTDEEKDVLLAEIEDLSMVALQKADAKGFRTNGSFNFDFHNATVKSLKALDDEIAELGGQNDGE